MPTSSASFMTAKQWNAEVPRGSVVNYYPVRLADGSPDPKSRRKLTTITEARQQGHSVLVQLDNHKRPISAVNLRPCQRYWVRVTRGKRMAHWVGPLEMDALELEELKAKTIAEGNSLEVTDRMPSEVGREVAHALSSEDAA